VVGSRNSWFAGTLVVLSFVCPPNAAAQQASCPIGYDVAFFNGVGNSEADAFASMKATQAAIEQTQNNGGLDVFDSEPVQYEVMYNHTQGSALDVAEVFIQRAHEVDPTGQVGTNFFYLFWEGLQQGPPQTYGSVASSNADFLSAFRNFVNGAITADVTALAALFTNPPTQSDYADQETQLTAAANAGLKLLLVAHSQGNLFVNHGYEFILPSVGTARMKVIHVAPASVTVHGPWLLSGNDLVINGLRLVVGANAILANNMDPPIAAIDPTGHGYGEIYLSPLLVDPLSGQTDQAILENLFVTQLTALDNPQCTLQISPASTNATPGQQVALTATISPQLSPDMPATATVTYKWSISGSAGGSFTNPATGGSVSTLVTTQPKVTYITSNSASSGQTDTINVELDVSSSNNGGLTTKTVASTSTTSPATIAIASVGLTFTASNGSACCGGVQPGTYSTSSPGQSGYGAICDNNGNCSAYGLTVVWDLQVPFTANCSNGCSPPYTGPPMLSLALAPGTTLNSPGVYTSRPGILSVLTPGEFFFLCNTCDNLGSVNITTVQPIVGGNGSKLATFTFTEASGSPASTRTYQGSGTFIIPQ
jgi:hypothetical protein